ncbi:MAG: CmcI family methyltransferase [Candidatus Wolfebacteria bacterium]|nr:CmcI family methyltransferase [Candidatus Wolfebacteria bacterium]
MANYFWRKSRNVIKNEGLAVFLSKSAKYIFSPVRVFFDKLMTKLFAGCYKKGFHKLFYYTFLTDMAGHDKDIRWFGAITSKLPLDMWIYQEVIWDTKPDFIIETGTDRGGSALFFATLFDSLGKGEVITIDINDNSQNVSHPRIKKIIGDSVSPEVARRVKEMVGKGKAIVMLDSDHKKYHVSKEMKLYSQFVPLGGYMVVEDTNINGHPVMPGWGPGPMEAVKEFLKERDDFQIDKTKEKFLATFYPNGFLKRIK